MVGPRHPDSPQPYLQAITQLRELFAAAMEQLTALATELENITAERDRLLAAGPAQLPALVPARTITVVVVEDEVLYRDGLIAALKRHDPQLRILGSATNSTDGAYLVRTTHPDVAVVDLRLPAWEESPKHEDYGLSMIREIHDMKPPARVLVLSQSQTPALSMRALVAGAVGYLSKDEVSKDPSVLVDAIHHVVTGMAIIGPVVMRLLQQYMNDRNVTDAALLPQKSADAFGPNNTNIPIDPGAVDWIQRETRQDPPSFEEFLRNIGEVKLPSPNQAPQE